MDTTARHATAIALLAVGCAISAASHAYSKEEDAAAQDREVQAAYDRGYKAAKEELAQKGAPAAAPVQKAAGAAPQKPILDIKHTYSDAGEVSTVMTVPVVVKPLGNGQGAKGEQGAQETQEAQDVQDSTAAAPAAAAAPAPEQTNAHAGVAHAANAAPAAAARQPQPHAYAQANANHHAVAATPPAQDDVAPPESLASDEAVDESEPPRSAQIYSTQGQGYAQPYYQPAQPRAQQQVQPQAQQYAPPPQPYGYAQQPAYAQQRPAYAQPPAYAQQQQPVYAQQYAQQQYPQQQPAYTQPRPAYYPPPAPWGSQQYQQPPARWVYWSPQYGRWMYY